MIVLNVTYKCKENMREAFLETIRKEGIDVASRAEAGNIKYDYYLPTKNDNEVFLRTQSNLRGRHGNRKVRSIKDAPETDISGALLYSFTNGIQI